MRKTVEFGKLLAKRNAKNSDKAWYPPILSNAKPMRWRNFSSKNIKPLVRWITAQRQFEWLARFGYAAKGMVYFVVGLLAAQAAIGSSQRKIDTSAIENDGT
jgi:hypothetical protein